MSNNKNKEIDFSNIKFYGRVKELQILKDAHESSSSKTQAVLIHGPPGAGKSRLLQEWMSFCPQQSIVFHKVHPNESKTSFSAVAPLLKDLCRHHVDHHSTDKAFLERLNVMPHLNHIINEDDKDESLETIESTPANVVLLKSIFCALLKSICKSSKKEPIVLVLDDLHHADVESLDYIATCLSDIPNNLLLVATHRGQCGFGKFWRKVKKLQHQKVALENFDIFETNHMIADLTCLKQNTTMPLTHVVHKKTRGNIFFVLEFLKTLQEKGFLYYSLAKYAKKTNLTEETTTTKEQPQDKERNPFFSPAMISESMERFELDDDAYPLDEHQIGPQHSNLVFDDRSTWNLNDREDAHDAMVAYESKRRFLQESQMACMQRKWQSHVDTARMGLRETQKAQRCMLACAHANQAHATAMEAIYKDVFLDDFGRESKWNLQKRRLAKRRSVDLQETNADSSSKSEQQEQEDTDENKNDETKDDSKENDSDTSLPGSTDKDDDMLGSLMASQHLLSEKFAESAMIMSMLGGQEMKSFVKQVETQLVQQANLGNALICELITIEQKVKQTWDEYDSVATTTLLDIRSCSSHFSSPQRKAQDSTESSSHNDCSASSVSTPEPKKPQDAKSSVPPSPDSVMDLVPTTNNTATTPPSPSFYGKQHVQQYNRKDIWLVEMKYRILVSYQCMAWNQAIPRITKCITSLVESECQRQERLHALLLAFLPRQTRLFMKETTTSQVQAKAKVQVFHPPTREKMMTDIETKVDQRVAAERHGDVTLDNEEKDLPEDVSTELEHVPLLDPPLMSSLVTKIIILERSPHGWRWKPTLAVLTVHRFLHLFDTTSKTSPQEAFEENVPSGQVRFQDAIHGNLKSCFRKKTTTPTMTLYLPNCTFAWNKEGRRVEIVESYVGAFKRELQRKLWLRVANDKESLDFVHCLKEPQESTVQEISLATEVEVLTWFSLKDAFPPKNAELFETSAEELLKKEAHEIKAWLGRVKTTWDENNVQAPDAEREEAPASDNDDDSVKETVSKSTGSVSSDCSDDSACQEGSPAVPSKDAFQFHHEVESFASPNIT